MITSRKFRETTNGRKIDMTKTKLLVLTFQASVIFSNFAAVNSQMPIMIQRDADYPMEEFKVFWNLPTYICKSYGVNFTNQLHMFGIIMNEDDNFRGSKVATLYDPGDFPITVKDANTSMYKEHNGGIPQLGDLKKHLKKFEEVVENSINSNLTGPAIIDFEVWRPIFRQNWNEQRIHRNLSIELEQKSNPNASERELQNLAQMRFEMAARMFMEETLKLAKMLRPRALWGYYGFPYCYNYRINDTPFCPQMAVEENDRLQWLFKESTALFPSIYLSSKFSREKQKNLIIGRLNEAWRVAKRMEEMNFSRVYPFVWLKYNDVDEFLTTEDLESSIEIPRMYHMGGLVIWGSSSDVNSKEKCLKLWQYLNTTLGPILLRRLDGDKVIQPSLFFWFWVLSNGVYARMRPRKFG